MHSAATRDARRRGAPDRLRAAAPPREHGHVDEHVGTSTHSRYGHRRGVVEPVGVGQRVAGDAGAAGERVAAVARARAAVEAAREQHARGDHADAGAPARRSTSRAQRDDADQQHEHGRHAARQRVDERRPRRSAARARAWRRSRARTPPRARCTAPRRPRRPSPAPRTGRTRPPRSRARPRWLRPVSGARASSSVHAACITAAPSARRTAALLRLRVAGEPARPAPRSRLS